MQDLIEKSEFEELSTYLAKLEILEQSLEIVNIQIKEYKNHILKSTPLMINQKSSLIDSNNRLSSILQKVNQFEQVNSSFSDSQIKIPE